MININFKDVPSKWALCYNDTCPLHESCLRFQAGKVVPADGLIATVVLSQAVSSVGCRVFQPIKEERLAWGFSHLFDSVSHSDYLVLRKVTEQILGSRYEYHRYHTGVKKLRKNQQKQLQDLFVRFGYSTPLEFDHLEDALIYE